MDESDKFYKLKHFYEKMYTYKKFKVDWEKERERGGVVERDNWHR